jgi:hypothetical protein
MEVIRFSETSAQFHWTARQYISGEELLQGSCSFRDSLNGVLKLGVAEDCKLKETGLTKWTEFICIGMWFGNGLL